MVYSLYHSFLQVERKVLKPKCTGTWYHIAVTHDGNNVFKIYLNGSLQESGTLSGTISKNTNGVTIGKYSLAGGYEFDGKIGMVKFHNKTFSATESGIIL